MPTVDVTPDGLRRVVAIARRGDSVLVRSVLAAADRIEVLETAVVQGPDEGIDTDLGRAQAMIRHWCGVASSFRQLAEQTSAAPLEDTATEDTVVEETSAATDRTRYADSVRMLRQDKAIIQLVEQMAGMRDEVRRIKVDSIVAGRTAVLSRIADAARDLVETKIVDEPALKVRSDLCIRLCEVLDELHHLRDEETPS